MRMVLQSLSFKDYSDDVGKSEFVEVEVPEGKDYSDDAGESVQEDSLNDDNDSQEVIVDTAKNDDAEVWEDKEKDSSNKNDDAEVWESDEGISPEDNAEVWENDKDYSDEEKPKSVKDRLKSIFGHSHLKEDDESGGASSVLGGLKFTKDLEQDLSEKDNVKEDSQDDHVDLGSDDDYIYVDHSNDEVTDEDALNIKFDKKVDDSISEVRMLMNLKRFM